ncbi:MAG TPA: hypothetical protein VKV32_09525 [Stellaceae bacterium]|nr:hypothetical protein [Stellaceae bacterium]
MGDYLRNFKRKVIENPLPLGLMGVSIAWMMIASAFGGGANAPVLPAQGTAKAGKLAAAAQASAGDAAERAADIGGAAADRAADIGGAAADRAADIGGAAADRAADIGGALADRSAQIGASARSGAQAVGEAAATQAAALGDGIADRAGAIGKSAKSGAQALSNAVAGLGRSSQGTSRAIVAFSREQPLIVTATGIFLGAILGALLPSTEMEDQLLGESADAAKETLREVAGEQYAEVKETATRTVKSAARRVSPPQQQAIAAKAASVERQGWTDVARRVLADFSRHRIMTEAAAVTFYAILAIFPALAALVSLYGLFADPSTVSA